MATYFKKRGWFVIEYTLGGKRVTKNTKLEASDTNIPKVEKLKRELEEILAQREKDLNIESNYLSSGLTLNQALKKFEDIHIRGKSNKHIEIFNYVMRYFKTVVPGGINVREISQVHIKNFLISMNERLSPATQVTYFQYIASFFGFLKENGYIKEVPISKGMRPKRSKKNIISFDPYDLENILKEAEIEGKKYVHAFKAFMLTGQRPGDVLRLQVRDIDFHRNIVYFRISKTASEFKFPLYLHLEAFFRNEMGLSENCDKELYLFPGLTVNAVGKAFRRIKKRLGLNRSQYYTLKTFRKNFATLMSKKGMTIQDVQSLLDHKSTETTLRYYADVRAEELKDKIDELMN